MRYANRLCLAITLMTGSTVAWSQNDDEPGAAAIEEIKVWGTRIYASSVDLDQEAIAIRQADHISDLLRTLPGVDVGGAHSLNQRITIRSMDDKDLRITIDGANQNTYMYHHMGNLQIHSDILESVDVQVGTNSVVDGGLGGTVRFRTKSAKSLLQGKRAGGRLQMTYADNAYSSLAATGYGQLSDEVDLLVYYNAIERDNYEVGGGEILGADGEVIAGTDGEVRGLEGDLSDGLIKLGWDLTDTQRLKIGHERYSDKGDYSYRPDMGLATDIAIGDNLGLPLTYATKFTRDTTTLNYDLSWGNDSVVSAAVFQNRSTLWRDETAIQEVWPADPGIVEGEAVNRGLNVLAESPVSPHHTLTYGADIIDYQTQYNTDGVARSSEKATNTALFIEDQIALGAFTLIPGARYNVFDTDSAVVDDRFAEVTGALALEWAMTSHLVSKVSATQLFKGPEIGEVFIGAGLYDTPNPGIEAETGVNSEFALNYEANALGADRLAAGFTVFRTDISDYIYDYAAPPAELEARYWKDNIGDMQIEGGEVFLGYDIGGFSSLLTFSSAESELSAFAPYASLDGARLDRQQGDTLSLNLDYQLTVVDLRLHWDVSVVDDVPAALDLDGATLDNSKDGYTVHNISALWAPAAFEYFTFTVGVDNLFDEYYASQSSRTGVSAHPRFGNLFLTDYEPGRNIKATVSVEL